MSSIYLIGGAPRSGKTTAIKQLVANSPMLAASTDAIRYTLRHVLSSKDYPELFEVSSGGFDSPENIEIMRTNPSLVVERQNNESEVVWKSCVDFIDSNIMDGQDIAIEGVAILPKNVKDLPSNYKVIILVNLDDQTEAIKLQARQNKNDWLHKCSDELIEAFCVFNMQQNKYFYDEAKRLDIPVAIINNETFNEDIVAAVNLLCRSTNK